MEEHERVESTNFELQRSLADSICRLAPLDELRLLLASGAKVTSPVALGLRPLHYACWQGYPEAAHLLLVRGAPVDALDDAGYSALHLSAEHGRLDLLRLLLEHGACVNFTPPGEECKDRPDEPLRLAIRNNHYEAARLLLEAGAHPNTRYFLGSDINLVSPLSIPFLELLLAFGAVPDARDRDGNTPLMKACRLPHGFDAALLLIHHGADVNAQAWERHDNRSVLHYAVLSGNPKIVNLVLKQGARVNFPPDYLKPTPLHLAILKGEPIIVRQLIEAGADVKAASPVIGTALQVACADEISNRMEMLRLLLGSGADPNAIVRSEDGVPHRGALAEYLASNHNPEMGVVRLLLEYGAKVVMRSEYRDPLGLLNVLPSLEPYPGVLEFLIGASEIFDPWGIQRATGLSAEQRSSLLWAAQRPKTLQHLARMAVRAQCMRRGGGRLPEVLEKLPLPPIIKRYVSFQIS